MRRDIAIPVIHSSSNGIPIGIMQIFKNKNASI
jgi:hypothetical protein